MRTIYEKINAMTAKAGAKLQACRLVATLKIMEISPRAEQAEDGGIRIEWDGGEAVVR